MIISKPKTSWFLKIWYGLAAVTLLFCLWSFFFALGANSPVTAKKAACISNLKQISTATLIYASDNSDTLPLFYTFDGADQGSKFKSLIISYVNHSDSQYDLFKCPSFEHPNDKSIRVPGPEGILGRMSYVHCLSLRGIIPKFSTGSRTLTLYGLDYPANIHYMRDPICGFGPTKDKDGNSYPGVLNSPHGGGFNIANLDGHVKCKTPVDINTDL
jgi:prepilin-type processing-associated H-X9-DG protein